MNYKDQPLLNKRILVTRAKEQANHFSHKIKKFGGIPIEIPLISIGPPKDKKTFKNQIREIHTYQWIVFTSSNGVKFFFEMFDDDIKRYWQKENRPQIAVVGKKTLETLKKSGLTADLLPDFFDADHLFEKLRNKLTGSERILLARGNLARNDLLLNLESIGYDTTDLIVYETSLNFNDQRKLYHSISNGKLDIITFTSSSTVHNFVQLLSGYNWLTYIENSIIACIGPITAKTAEQYGMRVEIIPHEYTIDGLIKEMIHYMEREDSQ